MIFKTCTSCYEIKPASLQFFYKCKKGGKFGLRSKCKECSIEKNILNKKNRRNKGLPHWTTISRRKEKAKKLNLEYENYLYLLMQKKNISEDRKKLNKLIIRLNKYKPKSIKKDSQYYKNHCQISNNDWSQLTKDNPEESTLIYRIRYKYDTEFNLKERIRNQLTKQKKKYPNLDYAIRQAVSINQNTKYFDVLGYTKEQLKKHLEKKFTDDMNWEEFRNGKIHIDHIKPQSLFDLKDLNDIKECWSLNNLQPLWAKENIKKSDKYKEK